MVGTWMLQADHLSSLSDRDEVVVRMPTPTASIQRGVHTHPSDRAVVERKISGRCRHVHAIAERCRACTTSEPTTVRSRRAFEMTPSELFPEPGGYNLYKTQMTGCMLDWWSPLWHDRARSHKYITALLLQVGPCFFVRTVCISFVLSLMSLAPADLCLCI